MILPEFFRPEMPAKMSNSFRYVSPGRAAQLLDLAATYGTPLYVYDVGIIRQQYLRLAKAFEGVQAEFHYAAKALSNPHVLAYIHSLGAGLDAVSIAEVQLALRAGYRPEEIIFTPNNVPLEEYEEAVKLGVRITLESIPMLELFAQKYPGVPIALRINPHIHAGGHKHISVGHVDSKFGISIHQLPHLLKLMDALNIQVEGLHMHTGSDILDAAVFLQAIEILFSVAEQFPDLQYLDFGSGFKVPYHPEDVETDIEEFGRLLSARFQTFCESYGRSLRLLLEPGKFLVSLSGWFLTRVTVVKPTPSTLFAGVDTGFNHFIRPMYYGARHEIQNLSNARGRKRVYSVVGNICETDTFGSNRMLNEVREGDVLCFYNAGAYCFSMASRYNSRPLPAEVLILEDGSAKLIRRRETIDDLLTGVEF